jgi:hypothetical protein
MLMLIHLSPAEIQGILAGSDAKPLDMLCLLGL